MSDRTEPVTLVTGASRGLGYAVAKRCLADGGRVMLLSRDGGRLAAAADELSALGPGRVAFSAGDAAAEADVARAFATAAERLGPVTRLVCNAGAAHVGALDETALSDWDRVVAANLTSAFLACRAFVRSAKAARHGGAVVLVSSVTGKSGAALATAYSAAKAGVIGLTRALAREAAPLGVRVNAVCPGAMETEMFRRDTLGTLAERFKTTPEALEKATLAALLVKRILDPGEVADLILYLLSGRAAGITGQAWNADGGFEVH